MPDAELMPKHIGIIMDGNGRWAKKRGLPRQAGHRVGASTFKKIARYCNKIGIRYLTVYAFSTENWKRPKEEINGIILLFKQFLNDAKNYKKDNIRIRFIGDITPFDNEIKKKISDCEAESFDHTGLTLNIAMNYGGRDELTFVMHSIAEEIKQNRISPCDISEEMISAHLYTNGQPDVDLIIRPSGEQRLSNFMLWQSAYAEYIFMDTLWPDFNEKLMDEALDEFAKRNRRFGGL